MKKMDDKYFVPDIEDLRVGYEYEKFFEYLDPQWISMIINDYLDMEVDLDQMRVPYLTKEQIEAEGWKVVGNNNQFDYFTKDKYQLDFLINGYGGENTVPYTISIGEDLYYPGYNGQCKSINEFRFICKLLKI